MMSRKDKKMERTVQQVILGLFWLIIAVEFMGVIFWWISTLDPVNGLLTVFQLVFTLFLIFGLMAFMRRRGMYQTDERIERHNERSVMIAGIVGMLTLLQVTVVEIITGLNFTALEILFAVGFVVMVTLAVLNIILQVQYRSG
ncbi:MAG: hypothetical protein ACXAEU_19740 [Candidatus Hodarchaeales archaeon]|jgi:hypothetical protein